MSKKTGPAKKKPGSIPAKRGQSQLKRLWATFGVALAAELFLILLYSSYVNGTVESIVSIYNALPFLLKAFPVAAAVCAALGVLFYRLKHRGSARLFGILAVLFLAFWAGDYIVIQNYAEGIKFLCAVVAAIAVLVLIFYVYQREFFFSALVTMGGILALWVYRRSAAWGVISTRVYVVFALGLLLLLLCAVLTGKLKRGKGLLILNGTSYRVFSSLTDYRPIFLSCAFVAVIMIASFFLGNMAAYFSMFVLAVYFFSLAVYSTVKLM